MVQIHLVQLSRLSIYAQICHTRYMLLIRSDGLLCIKVHTVSLDFFLRILRFHLPHARTSSTVFRSESSYCA